MADYNHFDHMKVILNATVKNYKKIVTSVNVCDLLMNTSDWLLCDIECWSNLTLTMIVAFFIRCYLLGANSGNLVRIFTTKEMEKYLQYLKLDTPHPKAAVWGLMNGYKNPTTQRLIT